jgi:hypothetical protein
MKKEKYIHPMTTASHCSDNNNYNILGCDNLTVIPFQVAY